MVGGSPVSSTTKTGRHDITEILLKVALNTINQSNINKAYSFQYVVDSPTYYLNKYLENESNFIEGTIYLRIIDI
jgi:hypothetical protein